MAKHDATRSALVVVGNSQAEAMARALRGVERVTDRYRVEFVACGQPLASSYEPGSFLLEQLPFESHPVPTGIVRRAAFPNLTCGMLWPLAAPNPLNHPEPDFPNGPFPYADAFLQACVLAGTSRPQMLRLYFQAVWSDSWPDLDVALRAESARLLELDRASGLQIGSFVLAAFRERRLFLNPDAPADVLLGELILQLLAPVFPREDLKGEVDAAFASLGTRDCLGVLAIPVHPTLARHYALTWASPLMSFNYFDREQLTDREYYGRYIEHVRTGVSRL